MNSQYIRRYKSVDHRVSAREQCAGRGGLALSRDHFFFSQSLFPAFQTRTRPTRVPPFRAGSSPVKVNTAINRHRTGLDLGDSKERNSMWRKLKLDSLVFFGLIRFVGF